MTFDPRSFVERLAPGEIITVDDLMERCKLTHSTSKRLLVSMTSTVVQPVFRAMGSNDKWTPHIMALVHLDSTDIEVAFQRI